MLDEIPEDFGSPLRVSRSRFVQIEPGFIRGLERALRFVSNRTLQTFLSSTGSYDGAVPREAVVRALDALNHVYWNDTSLRQGQKDLLRTLHQDLQKQLNGKSPGHNRLPRSPKTPSTRKPQLTLEEIKKRQQERRRSMSNLKQKLIRLGSEDPSLQKHLKPVLDLLTGLNKKSSSSAHFKVYGMGEFRGDKWEVESKLEDAGFYPSKVYSYGDDVIVQFSGPNAYDEAANAVGRLARHYQVSNAFRGSH